jgi:replication fork protection complex subunit Tof1/Swi1
MRLVGFERLAPTVDETPDSAWIIPSSLLSERLQDSLDMISKAEFDPPTFEDGALAQDQLRRKTAPRKKAVFDDDEGIDDDDDDDDDDILFPAGGPTNRKVADEFLDKPKKIRRRRRRSDAEPLTEEQLEEKERSRRERERAKAKRFKSELFVHASDDESEDEGKWAEFYANEERIRQRQKAAGLGLTEPTGVTSSKMAEKRKAKTLDSDESDNDDDLIAMTQDSSSSRPNGRGGVGDDDDEDVSRTDDTPLSSSPHAGSTSGMKRRRVSNEPSQPAPLANTDEDEIMEDADDEDTPASKPTQHRRPRARAGFIVDSSDEE